jgi:hypothetical protein
LKIALDYDGTYTLAPDLWDTFIDAAIRSGNEVVCVTMRYPSEPVVMPRCKVIYTSRKAKDAFYPADVWIDDRPHWIHHDSN